jgi:hypothetical protein
MSESVGDGGLEELGRMVNPAVMGGEMSRSWPFCGFGSGVEIDMFLRGNDGFVSWESERGKVSEVVPTHGTTFVTTRERKEGRDLEGSGAIFATE